MNKFVPELPKAKRKVNDIVSIKMDEDMRAKFYALCEKTGLSPSRMGNQMIRYAMENM